MNPRLAQLWILPWMGLLVGLCGCRGGEQYSELGKAPRVAKVGSFQLDDGAFSRFVRRETGLQPSDLDKAGRERLFEELLAEALLARGGERSGVVILPAALQLELKRYQELLEGGVAREVLEQEARRHLLAGAYEDQVLRREVRLPAGPAVQQEPPAPPGEQYVFRQIRVEEKVTADQAWRRVADGEPFDRVAQQLSTSLDRGRPLSRSAPDLPGPAAEVLRRMREGEVSRPLALDGAYYLFQLDARNQGQQGDRPRDREEQQRAIFQRALDELRQQRLVELARRDGVRAPVPAQASKESER